MTAGVPPPPKAPLDEECCHRHCEPCIFDYYEAALARWRKRITDQGLDPDAILAAKAPPP